MVFSALVIIFLFLKWWGQVPILRSIQYVTLKYGDFQKASRISLREPSISINSIYSYGFHLFETFISYGFWMSRKISRYEVWKVKSPTKRTFSTKNLVILRKASPEDGVIEGPCFRCDGNLRNFWLKMPLFYSNFWTFVNISVFHTLQISFNCGAQNSHDVTFPKRWNQCCISFGSKNLWLYDIQISPKRKNRKHSGFGSKILTAKLAFFFFLQ